MEVIIHSLKHALTITSFVFAMMLLIDYINVLTSGKIDLILTKQKFAQYSITSFLGVTPGCLGAFMNVSFYMHGIISFGALAGGMIATCGDGAFVMLSLFPKTAVFLFGILFVLGIIGGYIADRFAPILGVTDPAESCKSYNEFVEKCDCRVLGLNEIIKEFKNLTFERFLLLFILMIFTYSIIAGIVGPEEIWIKFTFLLILIISIFIIITVPQQYLKEHIWQHIVKKHVGKIFLWSFTALLVLEIGLIFFDLENLVKANMFLVLIISVLVGIIPESGPHLIFVMMFSKGLIPFSILLASSIVQDGHGMIPLLSCSVKDSIKIKLINVILGLGVGVSLYLFGI